MTHSVAKEHRPLQRRIIAFTIICILSICAVVAFASFYIFGNYLKKGIIDTTSSGLSNLSEAVDEDISEVFRLVRYCQSSTDVVNYIDALTEGDAITINKVHDRFTEEYQGNTANSYISRAAIVVDSHFLQVCQATHSTTKKIPEVVPSLSFYDALLSASDYDFSYGIIQEPFLHGAPRYIIPIIRPITYKYSTDQLGYVFVECSTSILTDRFQKYHLNDHDLLFFFMGDHIYAYDNGQLAEIPSNQFEGLSSFSEETTLSDPLVKDIRYNDQLYTLIKAPLKMKNCYIAHFVSPESFQSERTPFLLLFFTVVLLVIGIGMLLTIFMNRFMYRPVNKIRERIAQTAAGDFSRDPSIEWNNELGDIGRGINDLSESVNALMESRLADEKKKQDLEYQMLQSQINPHFLYNTLNSIKMMAQVQGATGISEMTTSLASLLRSISKGTSLLVPISEELRLLKDYFTIQNYRYGGMIEYEVHMTDPSIENVQIIKFTLQPLVENAIFHGLEPKGGVGKIDVNLYYKDPDTICIDVTDDGVGMPPEKSASILKENTYARNEFFKEIGIYNVNKRIQYEFGEDYGISVESELGKYTTMRILLPREKANDETSDC